MNKIPLLLLATGLGWILAACGTSPDQQAAITATALTATAVQWTPTHTSTFTPTLTLTPTSTPLASATPPPTLTLTPSRTPDPDRYYPPGTSMSMVVPEGWIPFTQGGMAGLTNPTMEVFFPSILIIEDPVELDLELYTAQLQDSLTPQLAGYKLIKEDFLTTPDGLPYFRWEFQVTNEEGKDVRVVMYVLEGGSRMGILQYTRDKNSQQKLDLQVEEAINSVRFEG